MITFNRIHPKGDPKFARTKSGKTALVRRTCMPVSESAPPTILREITPEQICVLTFNRPNSSANVFDWDMLELLGEHLDAIAEDNQIKGVVLISAKPSIFIAGADLHSIAKYLDEPTIPADLANLIELGQDVFNRLASLPVPTVAAIHGACVGGGFELALACDYRLASNDSATKLGLPETQLGLIPAWGGSTRLPRLIGFPAALDIILNGKVLAASQAMRRGLVDELVPKESLLDAASRRILTRGAELRNRRAPWKVRLINLGTVARTAAPFVHTKVAKKTRGHYPAVLKAVEVVTQGIDRSMEESLALERDAILELAGTDATRNLIRLFLLQERAKRLGAANHYSLGGVSSPGGGSGFEATPTLPRVSRAAVIGAGVMGAGIAHWLSSRGISVMLRDLMPEFVARGLSTIADLYAKGVKRRVLSSIDARKGIDRIYPVAGESPLNVDLVIEAAVEKMDVKKEIFRRLAETTSGNTILATNTSALSVSELAAATKSPDRVAGLHFFNPVHRMQLVEVVAGSETSPAVVARLVRFVQDIGKLPVVVKDSPGFIVNRILMPYLVEAGNLFEFGARVEDLDEAMLDFGMPMGPMRLIDEVGVDVAHHVAVTLAASFPDRLIVPDVLDKMLSGGLLGRKSEHGFYLHNADRPDVNAGVNLFRLNDSAAQFSRAELQKRMVLLMVNEAARCLEEGVATNAADIDFAMVMGTGFAPFHGGPLRYADALGAKQVVAELNHLADFGESHFKPCGLLAQLAERGESFYGKKGGSS
ncbi:MAG: 3-hydroxyacyl-CoA dehydrogenase NAD-binding domain-containing protein [Verrucomicrobiota bacterium]